MHVCSFVWAEGEGLGERLSQEAVPGRSSLDPEFLGRGLLSLRPQVQGAAKVSFPTPCTDPWASSCCQMCPCYWIFPASPISPFFFSALYSGISPYQASPCFPHPASGTLFGVGDGVFLHSSQRGSPENPGSGRKKLGSFACTSLVASHPSMVSHEVVPSLTPGWPPTLAVGC